MFFPSFSFLKLLSCEILNIILLPLAAEQSLIEKPFRVFCSSGLFKVGMDDNAFYQFNYLINRVFILLANFDAINNFFFTI